VSGVLPLSTNNMRFLQRLVADRPQRRPLGTSAVWFAEHYGVGTLYARHVEYLPRHFDQARELLVLHGLPVAVGAPDSSRADSAQHSGMSEKAGSRAPWANSVAVKAFGVGATSALRAAAGSFLVLTVEQALEVHCERILVVENLETFRYLEEYEGLSLGEWPTTLAMFRGDVTLTAADSNRVLVGRDEPVWAFMDFDPAGLGLASALPRMQRLVLPQEAWLRRAARGARGLELFERSSSQYQQTLSASSHSHVQWAWSLMSSLRAGVAQEGMAQADFPNFTAPA
jgi:hypothetical protein